MTKLIRAFPKRGGPVVVELKDVQVLICRSHPYAFSVRNPQGLLLGIFRARINSSTIRKQVHHWFKQVHPAATIALSDIEFDQRLYEAIHGIQPQPIINPETRHTA